MENELLFNMNTRLTRVEAVQEKLLEQLINIEQDMKGYPAKRQNFFLGCLSAAVALEKLIPLVLKAFIGGE